MAINLEKIEKTETGINPAVNNLDMVTLDNIEENEQAVIMKNFKKGNFGILDQAIYYAIINGAMTLNIFSRNIAPCIMTNGIRKFQKKVRAIMVCRRLKNVAYKASLMHQHRIKNMVAFNTFKICLYTEQIKTVPMHVVQ